MTTIVQQTGKADGRRYWQAHISALRKSLENLANQGTFSLHFKISLSLSLQGYPMLVSEKLRRNDS